MYCMKCGTELPSGAAFCKKCGCRVSTENVKNVYKEPAPKECSPMTAESSAFQKTTESNTILSVESLQNAAQKKHSKRTAYIVMGAVFTIIVLILISSLSFGNRLVGTWEKTSGRLWLLGYWEDHSSMHNESGELVFKSNDFYIVTDGDGYEYSDSYKVVDDSHLIMLCDGERNSYQYSISGNMLSLVDQDGETSFWKRN